MTLAIRIIPCLDVEAGRVVKGIKFRAIRDAGDPLEVAANYDAEGADELVMLDISASHEERKTLLQTVHEIAGQVFIPLTVGGGVSCIEDIRMLLRAGADKVAINTSAVKNPELVINAARHFGSQCIVVAIDARKNADGNWQVFTHGGRNASGRDAVDWARQMDAAGCGEILLTSMDRDGTKKGFDLELTRSVSDSVSVPVIASGGVGNLQHLVEGVVEGHANAVLAASIFHYGEYSIGKAKQLMAENGLKVRIET